MLVPFSKFSRTLQGISRYFDEMCGNSEPQMFVYWVFNYRKNEINAWKTWRLLWCAMVWPHHALVKIWEVLAYVVMHALHRSNHHQRSSMLSRGKSPRLKGNPNFLRSLPWSFFYDEHTPCKSPCSNLAFFRTHLPYLGDYVHFLSI